MDIVQWISFISGLTLILLAIVNAALMFETLSRRGGNDGLRTLHVWFGRIFVLMVVALFIYMIPRISNIHHFSPYATAHAVLGLALLPLAVWKLLIARRYKSYKGALPALGFGIMVATFAALTLTCGHLIAAGLSHVHLNH